MSKFQSIAILFISLFSVSNTVYADNTDANASECLIKHQGEDCSYTDKDNDAHRGTCQYENDKLVCVRKR